jgi:hypothetical protein
MILPLHSVYPAAHTPPLAQHPCPCCRWHYTAFYYPLFTPSSFIFFSTPLTIGGCFDSDVSMSLCIQHRILQWFNYPDMKRTSSHTKRKRPIAIARKGHPPHTPPPINFHGLHQLLYEGKDMIQHRFPFISYIEVYTIIARVSEIRSSRQTTQDERNNKNHTHHSLILLHGPLVARIIIFGLVCLNLLSNMTD